MSDPIRRALRGLLQLIAAGGLTAAVSALADGLSPEATGVILMLWQVVVTLTQNYLEDNTSVPALLKAPASEGVNPMPDGGGAP